MTGTVMLHPLNAEEMLLLSGGTDALQLGGPNDLLLDRIFSLVQAIDRAFATAPSSNYMYCKVGYSG